MDLDVTSPGSFAILAPDTARSCPDGPSLLRHPDTFLGLAETATDQRQSMPFRKTYPFEEDFLNDRHRSLARQLHASGMIDIGIEGWLLPPDALKLYEMAYHCRGDILELGSHRGLSASVMNWACNDSEKSSVVVR